MPRWVALGSAGLLVLFIAGVALVCHRFLQWRGHIERRLEADSLVVPTSSGLVEYADIGSGVPVLMIHGTPGGYDQILETVRASGLTRPGLRIIVPSRPGYLRTPITSGRTPAEQARLYADLLTRLGIDKAYILGASGGGPSALQFAILFPERCSGLILEEAATRSIKVERSNTPPIVVDFLIYLFKAKAIAAVQARDPANPVLARLGAASVETLVPFGRRAKGLENDRVQFAHMSGWPLASIGSPTLILHGTLDKDVPIADAEFAHGQIAGSEMVRLEGADHGMVAVRYKELNALIEAFISRHQKAGT